MSIDYDAGADGYGAVPLTCSCIIPAIFAINDSQCSQPQAEIEVDFFRQLNTRFSQDLKELRTFTPSNWSTSLAKIWPNGCHCSLSKKIYHTDNLSAARRVAHRCEDGVRAVGALAPDLPGGLADLRVVVLPVLQSPRFRGSRVRRQRAASSWAVLWQ